MISPSAYVMDLEKATFEEIIEKREELLEEIENLEKIVFDKEKKDSDWKIDPGPDVRYQVSLEYLAELCQLLSSKYNEEIAWADVDDFGE